MGKELLLFICQENSQCFYQSVCGFAKLPVVTEKSQVSCIYGKKNSSKKNHLHMLKRGLRKEISKLGLKLEQGCVEKERTCSLSHLDSM